MYVDPELLFFNFAEAFEEALEPAAHVLQALLLDDVACGARIALLRSLGELRYELISDQATERTPDDFDPEIRTILAAGILPALRQGRLFPDRLAALTRDADALKRLHHAMMADDESSGGGVTEPNPPDSEPALSPPFGFTALAERRDWSRLETELRPHLPYVLVCVGLPAGLADRLQAFLIQKARLGAAVFGRRRFRELIPDWLDEFARQAGHASLPTPLQETDWVKIIEASTVRLVLEEQPRGEPAWARAFRRAALENNATSRRDLASVTLPGHQARNDDIATFRRHLIARIMERSDRTREMFELN